VDLVSSSKALLTNAAVKVGDIRNAACFRSEGPAVSSHVREGVDRRKCFAENKSNTSTQQIVIPSKYTEALRKGGAYDAHEKKDKSAIVRIKFRRILK
jgi:hypothetical protein